MKEVVLLTSCCSSTRRTPQGKHVCRRSSVADDIMCHMHPPRLRAAMCKLPEHVFLLHTSCRSSIANRCRHHLGARQNKSAITDK